MKRLVLLAAMALTGCALAPTERVDARIESSCTRLFAETDLAVDAAGVQDVRTARIPGHPYLRNDRVLAGLAADARDAAAFAAWLRLAAQLDQKARSYELANLPEAYRNRLPNGIERSLNECRVQLAGAASADAGSRARLREAARMAPSAATAARDTARWRIETQAAFNTPPAALPRKGQLVRYAPGFLRPPHEEIQRILRRRTSHPLGLPEWTAAERDLVFIAFAPEIMIDEAGPDDRIGSLDHDHAGQLWVNFFRTVVYRRLTFVRLSGRWLPQLVYSVWFPARRQDGTFDRLSWRVTLGADGTPIVFDTMHDCDCDALFIPTAAVRMKTPAPFAPQSLNRMQPSDGVLVRLAAGTHGVQRVSVEDAGAGIARLRDARLYEMTEDDDLRSLPLPRGGSRAAFHDQGATPPVDDPDLLNRYFEPQ
jgi:hypothetical protein